MQALACPAFILLMLLTGCARHLPPADPAELRPGALLTADLQPVSLGAFTAQASQADFILIGESHANACDHRFQETALAALADRTPENALPGVGLEMVPWNRQEVLDLFLRGDITLDDLEKRLNWGEYWGFTFDLYRPILARAHSLGFALVGLNVPKDLLAVVRQNGLDAVSLEDRGLLPIAIIPPPPAQTESLAAEFQRHAQMMRGHAQGTSFDLERFLLVQSLWDTQMARTATLWRTRTRRPLVILAGSGHVDYGHGIAHRLQKLNHDPRILSLTPWRGGHKPDPAMADLFFYCPEEARPRLGMLLSREGDTLLVTGVVPDSRAERAGLLPGDILVKVNGTPVQGLDSLHQAGKTALRDKTGLSMEILRNGDLLEVVVPVAPEE